MVKVKEDKKKYWSKNKGAASRNPKSGEPRKPFTSKKADAHKKKSSPMKKESEPTAKASSTHHHKAHRAGQGKERGRVLQELPRMVPTPHFDPEHGWGLFAPEDHGLNSNECYDGLVSTGLPASIRVFEDVESLPRASVDSNRMEVVAEC